MMFQRQTATQQTCPTCGAKLTADRSMLRCETHGSFFAYGPQLLVRAPQGERAEVPTLMPWENHETRKAR